MLYYIVMKNTKNHKLKIAMIGAKGVPAIFGGVERSVDEMGSRLAERGHFVTVYSRPWYTKITKSTYKGMHIKLLPTIHTKHLDAIVHTFVSSVHAIFSGYDVIHYHGVGPALLAWIPRVFAPRAKVVVSFQSIDRTHAKWGRFARFALRMGERAATKFSHVVLASSFMIAQYIQDEFDVKAQYLPNGATVADVADSEVDSALLEEFSLESNKYIAVVTRLVQHKGVHEIIAAYKMARKENPEALAGIKLAIVGDGSFTAPYLEMLYTMAQNDNDIVFTGYQKNMTLAALMRNGLFAVHASHSEGLPMSVLELMGHGNAVLVSDIEPHKEVIKDEHLLFPTGDLVELKKAMIRLAADPAYIKRESKKAVATIEQSYNWDRVTAQLEAVYEDLVAPGYGAARTSVA